jgi:hypothetical protein
MTDQQLYLAIGAPMLFNALLIGVLMAYVNGQLSALRNDMNTRFDSVNQRFDDMRDLWRAELHRVESILDARLKHLEQR